MTSAIGQDEAFGEFDDYLCWSSVSVSDLSFDIYQTLRDHPKFELEKFSEDDLRQLISDLGSGNPSEYSRNAYSELMGRSPDGRASALASFAEDDIRRAIAEIGSIYHENQHIQDVFGTPAGLSIVFGFWEAVLRFLRVASEMQRQGKSWRLPLPIRLGTDRNALLTVRMFLLARELYDTPLPPTRVEATTSGFVRKEDIGLAGCGIGEHAVVLDFEAGDLAAFHGAPEGVSSSFSVAMPLGFEAFLEGHARIFEQAKLVGLGFPPDMVRSVLSAGLFAGMEDSTLEEALDHGPRMVLPYETTAEAIATLLSERNLAPYEVAPILSQKLHEIVLLENELVSGDMKSGAVISAIPDFGASLKRVMDRHSDEALQAGEIFTSTEGAERLDNWRTVLLDILEQEPDVSETETTYIAVQMWRRYLASHIALPMLHKREKIIEDTRNDEILARRYDEALPSIESYMGGQLQKFDAPTTFFFFYVAFLIEILRQAFSGNTVVRCPHRSEIFPFADAEMNFAEEGTCRRWIALGCGTFNQDTTEIWSPNCIFESVLSDCGFKRPERF